MFCGYLCSANAFRPSIFQYSNLWAKLKEAVKDAFILTYFVWQISMSSTL
jgi:hypothetical protein